jgi:hypothetical protein
MKLRKKEPFSHWDCGPINTVGKFCRSWYIRNPKEFTLFGYRFHKDTALCFVPRSVIVHMLTKVFVFIGIYQYKSFHITLNLIEVIFRLCLWGRSPNVKKVLKCGQISFWSILWRFLLFSVILNVNTFV